jgi:hypothetical protein
MQVRLFSISSYAKISSQGLPNVTIFSNIPTNMTEPAKQKWGESIRGFQANPYYLLFPHYTLLGLALADVQIDLKLFEFKQGLYVSDVVSDREQYTDLISG